MIMGAIMGKKYSWKKYLHVFVIVAGVALFMGGGDTSNKDKHNDNTSSSQWIGIFLLFISLCFDGGTGAYEDKLMAVHSVGPFDLMYNIQLGKTILAGVGLIVFNQIHLFLQMCQQMGLVLVALGLTGALGQVFIFVTIAKFGALTCSIIGLARKITTLLASIFVYGHKLSLVQIMGLVLSIGSMLMEFSGKKKGENNPPAHTHVHVQPEQDLDLDKIHPTTNHPHKGTAHLELPLFHPTNKLTVMTAGVS
jgi:UDP-galactose transporter B1